jgi:hypothetical protein
MACEDFSLDYTLIRARCLGSTDGAQGTLEIERIGSIQGTKSEAFRRLQELITNEASEYGMTAEKYIREFDDIAFHVRDSRGQVVLPDPPKMPATLNGSL